MKHLAYIILCFAMLCNVHLVNAQGDVKIGKQTWMSKNLDVSTFRNGEQISQAKDVEQWKYAGTNKIPAWCFYEFNESNGKKYGKLYNWFAVSDSRGLAPNGYHIPSDAEWTILTDFLGGSAAKKMKSKDGWEDNGNGDNSSRFNGLPGGYCQYYGNFYNIAGDGYFWSSSEDNTDDAWLLGLYGSNTEVASYPYDKGSGLSVRCLRD